MAIRSEDVKKLRDETGVGMMDCKRALVEAQGDFARAKQLLREQGLELMGHQPRYISPEDVPEEDLETEREVYRKQLEKEGKPAQIIEKAVEGRLKKFYEQACLIKQPFVKDPTVTIEELLADLRTKTGENIYVKRFVRYEVGEDEG